MPISPAEHLGLVRCVARRFGGSLHQQEDLFQEGCLGLIEACKRFDSGRGTKFSTYATWWIRKAILLSIAREQSAARAKEVAAHKVEADRSVPDLDPWLARLPHRARRILELHFGLKDGRRWAVSRIARRFHLPVCRVRRILASALRQLRDQGPPE